MLTVAFSDPCLCICLLVHRQTPLRNYPGAGQTPPLSRCFSHVPPAWEKWRKLALGAGRMGCLKHLLFCSAFQKLYQEPKAKAKMRPHVYTEQISSHILNQVGKVNKSPTIKKHDCEARAAQCVHTIANSQKRSSPLHGNMGFETHSSLLLFKVVIPCLS